jgi:hypothetical protein
MTQMSDFICALALTIPPEEEGSKALSRKVSVTFTYRWADPRELRSRPLTEMLRIFQMNGPTFNSGIRTAEAI